jgi:hypothetical protein
VSQRLGECVTAPKDDERYLLDKLAESKLIEEEASAGPIFFGPCIHNEPFSPKFSLPWDMPNYTAATKLDDWLSDYSIAIDIAGGNKRLAVCYAPLML